MNAKDEGRTSGAVDQEAFEKVIRDNLSPEVVRDKFDQIRDETDYYVPEQPTEEFSHVFPKL